VRGLGEHCKRIGRRQLRTLWTLAFIGGAGLLAAACAGPGIYATGSLGSGGLPPGLWRTIGGDACYWARLQAFSGQPGDVIADDLSHRGPRYVQISATDAGFEQRGCLPFWQEPGHFAKPLATPGQPFGPGDFKVGYELAPGVYTSPGASSVKPKAACYWARLTGFGGTVGEITQSSVTTGGSQTATIESGDTGFTSDNCGTWTKVG
jgi:hypothetical protein